MKIKSISVSLAHIPLNTVFRTALRTVDAMENVMVRVETDKGLTGYGSAAPTTVITGETVGSIIGGVEVLHDNIVGMEIETYERVFQKLNTCLVGNMSAKAAVDMALHDLIAKSVDIPLCQFLGGPVRELESDITISLDEAEKMGDKARERIREGFDTLKIKVGGDPGADIARLQAVREAVGCDVIHPHRRQSRLESQAGCPGRPGDREYVPSTSS